MNASPTSEYDLRHYLTTLDGASLEEVEKAVAAKIEELESKAISVKGRAKCRDVGILKFLFDLKELREFLHYHYPPATVSPTDLAMYRPLFDALVTKGDWPEASMYMFSERKPPYASFFGSELEREKDAATTAPDASTPATPPPLPLSASPQRPPPLPTQRNPKEPPPLPRI